MIRGTLRGLTRLETLKGQQEKLLRRTIFSSQKDRVQQIQKVSDSEDIIIRSPYPSVKIPEITLEEFVWKDMHKWSDKVAIVDALTRQKLTYAELRDNCRILAIRVQKNFGLQIGDTVAVCLPNCCDFPVVALGSLEAGMIVTTINPIYTADEIAKQLMDSGAKVIFGLARMSKVLENAVAMTKENIKIIYVKYLPDDLIPEGGVNYADLLDSSGLDLNSLKPPNRTPQDISFLPYSSGTTGKSKGVLLTHRNINSNSVMIAPDQVCQETTDTYQDVLPCVLPFFHIYGLTVTLISKLALGTKNVTLPSFSPDTFLKMMEEYKGTVLHLVPPIVLFLANYPHVQKKHLESINLVMTGAAPIGKSDVDRFVERSPHIKFFQGYGLTEASPAVLMNYADDRNFASVGQPCPNTEVKIVAVDDPTHKGLGPNKNGELFVRGPQIMKGYHNNEEATKETLLEDGWMRTGDIAYYDDKGQFYITDRLKELIKVKGYQVAPAELEELLRSHPKIADAGVVAVYHPSSGEVPKAFVVKRPSVEVSEKEIQEFVNEQVAPYKKLEGGVQFLDSIPKNITGKIMRKTLKEKYC